MIVAISDSLSGGQTTDNIKYFAYGPMADRRVALAVIGRKTITGRSAILEGYKLYIQSLKHIPRTPREQLVIFWGKKFEMHVVKKGKGKVKGVIWFINKEDLAAIRSWELIDKGWYSFVKGTARLRDNHMVKVTTIAVKNQAADREIDGLDYDIFFGKGAQYKRKFIAHAKSAYKRFKKR